MATLVEAMNDLTLKEPETKDTVMVEFKALRAIVLVYSSCDRLLA